MCAVCVLLLLQSMLQKPNVTLPDVNAILTAALAQHTANMQVGQWSLHTLLNCRRADGCIPVLADALVVCSSPTNMCPLWSSKVTARHHVIPTHQTLLKTYQKILTLLYC